MTDNQEAVNAIHKANKTERMARFHLATADGEEMTVEAPLVECMPAQVRIMRSKGYYVVDTETFEATVGTTHRDDLPEGD